MSSEIFPVSIPLKGSFPPLPSNQNSTQNKTTNSQHLQKICKYAEFESNFQTQWGRMCFRLFESLLLVQMLFLLLFVQRPKEGNRNSYNAQQSFTAEESFFFSSLSSSITQPGSISAQNLSAQKRTLFRRLLYIVVVIVSYPESISG